MRLLPGVLLALVASSSIGARASNADPPLTEEPKAAAVSAVPTPSPAAAAVSFKRDLVPVLRRSCAACHLTGTEPGNLALHPGAAYKNLVAVASTESKWLRVKPGAPDESYLMMKLDGTHLDGGGTGARMPFAAEPLDEATRKQFREWIASGALEN